MKKLMEVSQSFRKNEKHWSYVDVRAIQESHWSTLYIFNYLEI